jgi:Plasmid encoded RepA protein
MQGPAYSERRIERHLRIIRTAAEVKEITAEDADAIGFQAWIFTQVSMPHKAPRLGEPWRRRNGRAELLMQPGYGRLRPAEPLRQMLLPSGATPRLMLSWLVSRFVSNPRHDPVVELPDRQRALLRELHPGRIDFPGSRYARFRLDLVELTVARLYVGDQDCTITSERPALWWDERAPDQPLMFPPYVRLSAEFCAHILRAPVPLDRRTLSSLSGSTVAMDVYLWLTWRLPQLVTATLVRWPALAEQFSSGYSRSRDFRRRFEVALREVLHAYPTAMVEPIDEGLVLRPSPPHLPRRMTVVDAPTKRRRLH